MISWHLCPCAAAYFISCWKQVKPVGLHSSLFLVQITFSEPCSVLVAYPLPPFQPVASSSSICPNTNIAGKQKWDHLPKILYALHTFCLHHFFVSSQKEEGGERRKKWRTFQFGQPELPRYTALDAVGWVCLSADVILNILFNKKHDTSDHYITQIKLNTQGHTKTNINTYNITMSQPKEQLLKNKRAVSNEQLLGFKTVIIWLHTNPLAPLGGRTG